MLIAEGADAEASPAEFDAWTIKDKFFEVRKSSQLLPFLEATGRFTQHSTEEAWSYRDFGIWKQIIRELTVTKPGEWERLISDKYSDRRHAEMAGKFEGSFRVKFEEEEEGLYVGVITVHNTLMAMLAAVYVDWMAGVKYGFCERTDCGRPFELSGHKNKRFCDRTCSHNELMRRSRAKAKAEAAEAEASAPIDEFAVPMSSYIRR